MKGGKASYKKKPANKRRSTKKPKGGLGLPQAVGMPPQMQLYGQPVYGYQRIHPQGLPRVAHLPQGLPKPQKGSELVKPKKINSEYFEFIKTLYKNGNDKEKQHILSNYCKKIHDVVMNGKHENIDNPNNNKYINIKNDYWYNLDLLSRNLFQGKSENMSAKKKEFSRNYCNQMHLHLTNTPMPNMAQTNDSRKNQIEELNTRMNIKSNPKQVLVQQQTSPVASPKAQVARPPPENNVKLIGKGSYGCVVQPPIKTTYVKIYKEYHNAEENDIGKLFKAGGEKSFLTELDIAKFVQNLDPENKFTVALKGAFQIKSTDIISGDNDINNCLFDVTKTYTKTITKSKTPSIETSNNQKSIINVPIYQIVYDYGGEELTNIPKINIPFSKLIKMIIQLLEGVKSLHRKKYIHRDIKPPNVLVNDSKICLIDFGILEEAQKVFSFNNHIFLSYSYMYYPPEFFIASQLIQYKDKDMFQNELKRQKNDLINHSFFKKTFHPSYMRSVTIELEKFIDTIIEKNFSYNEVFNEEMAYKCDIYSLSSLFKVFYSKIKYPLRDQEKTLIFELYQMSSQINPYKRASINSMINKIKQYENEGSSTMSRPPSQINTMSRPPSQYYTRSRPPSQINTILMGGKKRIYFAKKYRDNCNETRITLPYKYKMPYNR